MIVLEMKCPQLSKPEATTARNQNSIGDRTEKKTLGETRLSWGASSPLARWTSSLFQLQKSQVQVQVKLSFIVIPLHVWTYSGTRCRASQDHGAT